MKLKYQDWRKTVIKVGPLAAGDNDPFAILEARDVTQRTTHTPRRGSRADAVDVTALARAAIRKSSMGSYARDGGNKELGLCYFRSVLGGPEAYEEFQQSRLEAR